VTYLVQISSVPVNYRDGSAVQRSLSTLILPHIKGIITTGTKHKNIKVIISKILYK
jgi:hypothetical protein